MLTKLGLFIFFLFGFHAILEYKTGGYNDYKYQNCKIFRSHNRCIWNDDDSVPDFKTIK